MHFPQQATPGSWWNVFQFKSLDDEQAGSAPVWVFNVGNRASGTMYFYLWDGINTRSFTPATTRDVPVGRWTHLEAN
jgi:hypothetical protein